MPVPYPTTDDAPTQLAILPDWGEPITQRTVYRTEMVTSRRGLEQRTQHRRRPVLSMEYRAEGIHDAAARKRIESIVESIRGGLLVPWWPQGALLQSTTTPTSALISTNPIGDDWDQSGFVYLWARGVGGEFRQLASRAGRTMTLIDEGGHLTFPAGGFCFPVREALRDDHDVLLAPGAVRTNPEKLIFRTR